MFKLNDTNYQNWFYYREN